MSCRLSGQSGRRRGLIRLSWAAALVSLALPAQAQTIDLPTGGSIDLRQIEQLQQMREQANDENRTLAPRPPRAMPVPDPTAPIDGASGPSPGEPSPLERQYTQRAGTTLKQVGYDLMRGQPADRSLLSGKVPEDYILGPGDEVVVTLRGQVNRTMTSRVDRAGNLVINDLVPIPAAGRTFADFRADLEARAAASFLRTEVFVSIGTLRSISVLVTGEVVEPGQQVLTSFSSLIDAIISAKGVARTGSLRQVRLVRNGETKVIDLYGVLVAGASGGDLRLRDGDHIVVTTLGPTIAVAGDVVRAGIFELPAGSKAITVADAVMLAGGAQRPSGNRLAVLRLDPAGRSALIDLTGDAAQLRPGDVLTVTKPLSAFAIDGAAELPGELAAGTNTRLSDVLRRPGILSADPYLPLAVVDTEEPVTRQRRLVPVDLRRVLDGKVDMTLRQRDRLVILSRQDIRYLSSADVQAVLRGDPPPSLQVNLAEKEIRNRAFANGVTAPEPEAEEEAEETASILERGKRAKSEGLIGFVRDARGNPQSLRSDLKCEGLRVLAAVATGSTLARFTSVTRATAYDQSAILNVERCPRVFDRNPDLLPFLLEHGTTVEGEVRYPGIYPVLSETPVARLVEAAGGMSNNADADAMELTQASGNRLNGLPATRMLAAGSNPGDALRIPARQTLREQGVVEVRGEVLRPGKYDIRRGERLSDLLRRAGGITDTAFLYGAVFTRERARDEERRSFERSARDLELAIPTALAQSGDESGALRAGLPALQSIISSLRNTKPVGRIVVESDPDILVARPELDILLEPGDLLVIPKRPAHVTIAGEVLNPGSVLFKSGQTGRDYLRVAGGTTEAADVSRAFIVFPNGEARSLGMGRFSDADVPVPPGSTIVIPRDPAPFSLITSTRSILSVVSNLAVTAASLAVISSN